MTDQGRAPRGPTGLLSTFQLVCKMRADLLGYFVELGREYGDIVSYSLGGTRIVQLDHPDPAIEVLSTTRKGG